jgi:hypothetical protein
MYRNSRFGSAAPLLNRAKSTENNGISDTKSWSFFNWNSNKDNKLKIPRHLEMKGGKDISEEFSFTVPKDIYLSPYRASDSLLERFPPIKILVSYQLIIIYIFHKYHFYYNIN